MTIYGNCSSRQINDGSYSDPILNCLTKIQGHALSRDTDLQYNFQGGFLEIDLIPRPHLGDEGEVNSDDIGYAGIATGGLVVSHEDDGLAVTGDLNGTQRDACRDDVGHPFLCFIGSPVRR